MNLDHQIASFFQSAAGNLKLLVAQSSMPWSLQNAVTLQIPQDYQHIEEAIYNLQCAAEILPPDGVGPVETHVLADRELMPRCVEKS
ncbi:MAG: hypothetical protein LBJ95_03535 [Oscillospiraceae bacterium]|jgi:hypothetical protein|nr:hypothetical protein [Oscillospiraceae bacterium]